MRAWKRLLKVFKWTGAAAAVLFLLVCGFSSWVLWTQPGAQWALARVSGFVPGLALQEVHGTLAGPLTVLDIEYEPQEGGLEIRLDRLRIDPLLQALLRGEVRVESLIMDGLFVDLPQDEQNPPESSPPPRFDLQPPLDIAIEELTLENLELRRGGEPLARIDALALAGWWNEEGVGLERLLLKPAAVQGTIRASGRIAPAGQSLRADLEMYWREVTIPQEVAGRALRSSGRLDVAGAPDNYVIAGELAVGLPEKMTELTLRLQGSTQRVRIERLELEQASGRLALTGAVELAQELGWQLAATANSFDPGEFLPAWPGNIDLQLATKGQLTDKGPRGEVQIDTLSGRLRGRKIAGSGELTLAPPLQLAGKIQLSSGASRVAIEGRVSEGTERLDATVDLQVASLSDWLPDAEGKLSGHFSVQGAWPQVAIRGQANGRDLKLAGTKVERLRLRAEVDNPTDPSGTALLTAAAVSAAGLQFGSVVASITGGKSDHRLMLEARGEPLELAVGIRGALADSGWHGRLEQLALEAQDIANLTLQQPAGIVYADRAFDLSQTCLRDGDIGLCVAAEVQDSGALLANYSLENVPLGLANTVAPEALPGELRGQLRGEGQIRRAPDGRWFGTARIISPAARLLFAVDEEDAPTENGRTLLLYEDLQIEAQLEGDRASARIAAQLQAGGSLAGEANLAGIGAPETRIDGQVTASLPTLEPFAPFVPQLAGLDGAIEARVAVAGSLDSPEITGLAQARKLKADLVQLGIELREGSARIESRIGGGFTLSGGVRSGKGHIKIDGAIASGGEVDLEITGQNFLAVDIPAVRVVVAPQLAFLRRDERMSLTGEVSIPTATVNIQKLPQGRPQSASPDVVVIRDGVVVEKEDQRVPLPLHAEVTIELGEDIALTGFGLEAALDGQLLVRESPQAPTTGSGELRLSGQYQAYGQDLTIQEGQLLFAGTPLDDPRLNITAIREIDEEITAGLRIGGTAQSPQLTVFSDPALGEGDALSYLVTGRSLSDVGAADSESQGALQSATRSLQTAAGGLLAGRIGRRLGLDEAGVEESELLGGAALTVGEYLSPRLYLSYGVGLFEPGEVIALRYRLSDDVGVRVQRGSEETRAGIEYRIEN